MNYKALELTPENAEIWGNLGDAYRFSSGGFELSLPMYQRAIDLSLEYMRINPADADSLALLAHYYANMGNREMALTSIGKAIVLAPEQMNIYYVAATTHCALDDFDQALAYLERAVEYGYPWQLAAADRGLFELRKMPRFEALGIREE